MVFDSLVFLLSAVKVAQLWIQGARSSILKIILRDGLLYYLLCTSLQIGNLVYFYTSSIHANKAFLSPLLVWVTSMSVSDAGPPACLCSVVTGTEIKPVA